MAFLEEQERASLVATVVRKAWAGDNASVKSIELRMGRDQGWFATRIFGPNVGWENSSGARPSTDGVTREPI